MKKLSAPCLALLPSIFAAALAQAQETSLIPQRSTQNLERASLPVLGVSQPPAEPPTSGAAVSITPKRFAFDGNSVIKTEDLERAVTPWLGRELDLKGLNEAVDAIKTIYRQRGYVLASSFLPAQRVSDGVITIGILEGSLGKINISMRGDAKLPVSKAKLESYLASHAREGDVIDSRALERPLLLIEDNFGVRLNSSLATGAKRGTADLEVEVAADPQQRAVRGNVQLDNNGSLATGRERLSLKMDFNGLAGIGDTLNLQGTVTKNQQTVLGNLAWSLPVGNNGLRAGLGYTQMRYTLGDQFAALDADGTARVFDANLNYPFLRSRSANIYGRAAVQVKHSENRQLGAVTQSSAINGLSFQLSGDWRELDSGNAWAATMLVANNSIPEGPQRAADQSVNGFHTHGEFAKLNLDYQRVQQLNPQWSVLLRGAAQLASQNLNGAEKFVLGGPDRIRGQALGEGSGDAGFFASGELRVPVPQDLPGLEGLMVSGFYDFGRVKRNRSTNDAPLADQTRPAVRALGGAGLGLKVGRDERWVVRAELARPVGDKSTVDDKTWRFWLRSMIWF